MRLLAPRTLLHLEGIVVLVASCALYHRLGASWWLFAILFLAPDLSMLGYLAGTRIGAAVYNAGHTYAAIPVFWALGAAVHLSRVDAFALIWLAHLGFDRALGYGLKYPSGFKDTHLERV